MTVDHVVDSIGELQQHVAYITANYDRCLWRRRCTAARIQRSLCHDVCVRPMCVCTIKQQEAQLMLTTGSTRLAVSRGQQTWYHSTCYI